MGMQSHVIMQAYLQEAKRKTQRRIRLRHAGGVSVVPAGWTCPVLLASGWRQKFFAH